MAEYATHSVGTAGLTTGVIGSALGVLNSGLLGNIGIGGNNAAQYATKDDLANAIALAQKDSEIALLKANAVTRQETVDVFERVMTRVNADKAEQAAINAQQSVYNAANNSAINLLNNQVSQLMGLTVLHIPAANVCPEPMSKYNSWTAPTT